MLRQPRAEKLCVALIIGDFEASNHSLNLDACKTARAG